MSRSSEKALAILLHGEAENDDRSAYRKNVDSFRRENPGEIEKMFFDSANDIRRLFRDHQLAKPPGRAFADIPLLKLDLTFWEPHFEMFARKLLLAIHYQCFGSPVPRSGGVVAGFHSNFEVMSKGIPEDLLQPAVNLVAPLRNGKTLDSQFAVRYNVVSGKRAGLFALKFHDKMLITGITTDNVKWLSKGGDMWAPFNW